VSTGIQAGKLQQCLDPEKARAYTYGDCKAGTRFKEIVILGPPRYHCELGEEWMNNMRCGLIPGGRIT